MFEFIAKMWDTVLNAGSHLAAFGALVMIIAIYAFPVLALVGFFFLWRNYRRERYGLGYVDGVLVADGYSYARTHTWIGARAHGGRKVGIDDIARRILGRIEAIELPKPGTLLQAGDAAAIVTCKGGREVMIPTPVAGTVTAINRSVVIDPELVDAAPYTHGWLFAIEPLVERPNLPTRQAARDWFVDEERRFGRFLENQFGLAAADGGRFVTPPSELLNDAQWKQMVDQFLR